MPWAVKFPGNNGDGDKSVRLDDLDIGVLEDFAAEHGTEWVSVVFTPLVNLRTSKALIELCAKQAKVKIPASTKWTSRFIMDHFEDVADDLPETIGSDGLPPQEQDVSETAS